jgi:hypothetical protein
MNDADISAFFRDCPFIDAEIGEWQKLAAEVKCGEKLPPFKGISQGKKY